MSAVFASPDIVSLVANYSPTSVSNGRPTLIRSRSGYHLFNLTRTTARFTRLLQTSESRLDKSKLAFLLDVEDGVEDWLCEGVNLPLRETRDGCQLLPAPVTDSIVTNLLHQARSSIVSLNVFATEADIKLESLEQLVDSSFDDDLRRVSEDGSTFFCSDHMANYIKAKMRDGIGASGSDIYDLNKAFPDSVPHVLLLILGKDVAEEMQGEIRLENDRAIYVPANSSATANEKLKQTREDAIQELLQRLYNQGYCLVDYEKLEAEEKDANTLGSLLLDEWRSQHPEEAIPHSFSPLHGTGGETVAFVLPNTLWSGIENLKASITTYAETLFRSDQRSMKLKPYIQSIQRHDTSVLDLDELGMLLCSSEHFQDLVSSLARHIDKLEHDEQEHFSELVEARLLIPLDLYAVGIDTVKDATLKQHLEEFTADRFRRETIPQMVNAVNERSLLWDKERARQTDKLKRATSEAKSLLVIQDAVAKFMRKVKLDTPAEGHIRRVKYKTLEAAAKSIRQMSRGSDILQNLIWILLAQASAGLFMSSGKDTSRMIKQYEAVGDPETAKMLIQWRDKLKTGQDSEEDMQSMKDAASTTIEQLAKDRRKSSASN